MDQKVALITAGGSGMGAGIARVLAEKGYKIAILSSSGKGEALAKELGGIGVTGSNLNMDDLQRFVDTAKTGYGRIDCVVNSAGHGPKGKLLELSDDGWLLGMNVYFMNLFACAGWSHRLFKLQGAEQLSISPVSQHLNLIRPFPLPVRSGPAWPLLPSSIRMNMHLKISG